MRTVLRNAGLILFVPAALALLNVGIGLVNGDPVVPFLATFATCLVAGSGLFLGFRNCEATNFRNAMATAVAAWGLFSCAASFPFWIAAPSGGVPPEFGSWENCLFEGTSAATSSGLTVTRDTGELTHAFQFWRSICQWVGGLGVLVLAIAVFELGKGGAFLFRAAARSKTLEDDIRKTTRAVWKVHLLLTIAVFLAFGLAGMPWWEAVNHSLTTVATGGFTMNGAGAGAYGVPVKIVMIIGMCTGSISFVSHYRAIFLRQFRAWLGRPEHWLFFAFLATGLVLAAALPGREIPLLDRLFLWTSALTTTGFSTADPASVSPGLVLLLLIGMFVGGMAGSTAGGVKVSRVQSLGAFLIDLFRVFLRRADEEDINALETAVERKVKLTFRFRFALMVFGLWIVTTAVGTISLMLLLWDSEFGIIPCLFEVLSALGCVGLSSGVTSADLETAPKLVLCALMWAGRIELVPVLVVAVMLLPINWQKRLERSGEAKGN